MHASAPDLLEALETISKGLEEANKGTLRAFWLGCDSPAAAMIRAAIAKARGEA